MSSPLRTTDSKKRGPQPSSKGGTSTQLQVTDDGEKSSSKLVTAAWSVVEEAVASARENGLNVNVFTPTIQGGLAVIRVVFSARPATTSSPSSEAEDARSSTPTTHGAKSATSSASASKVPTPSPSSRRGPWGRRFKNPKRPQDGYVYD